MKPSRPAASTRNDNPALARPLWRMALPVMASMTSNALYGLMDGMFVASTGEAALAAVTLAAPASLVMVALATGTGPGITAFVSRCLGECDRQRAGRGALGALVLALAYFAFSAGFALFGAAPFMELQGASDAVADSGRLYLAIVCGASLGYYVEVASENVLLGCGRSKLVMASQLAGAALNVALDFLLVPGFFGLPAFGVAGAATATVVAQTAAAALSVGFNLKVNRALLQEMAAPIPLGGVVASILRVGVPGVAIQLASCLSGVVLNGVLMGCSQQCVVAYGAYLRLQNLFFMPVYGIAASLVPMASYRFWSRDAGGLRRLWRQALLMGASIMAAACATFWAAALPLASLFVQDPVSAALCERAFRTLSLGLAFAAVCVLGNSMLQACGKPALSFALTAARLFGGMLPLAFAFAWAGGEALVWWALPASDALFAVIAVCAARWAMARKAVGARGRKAEDRAPSGGESC